MSSRLVHVVFPPTGAERSVQVLRVGLRDVSRADAPSPVLAEARTGPLVIPAEGTTVALSLEPDDAAAGRLHGLGTGEVTVFAHAAGADRDDVEEGDYLSTVSVALPEDGDVVVPVTYLPVTP